MVGKRCKVERGGEKRDTEGRKREGERHRERKPDRLVDNGGEMSEIKKRKKHRMKGEREEKKGERGKEGCWVGRERLTHTLSGDDKSDSLPVGGNETEEVSRDTSQETTHSP